jgi:hypothetical protein
MPIDPLSESTMSLTQAARRLPRLRAGRPVHPSTVWRWALTGLRGVKLETAMVGSVRVTTEDALRRFFQAVGNTSTSDVGGPPAEASPSISRATTRERHDEDVERQLDDAGL